MISSHFALIAATGVYYLVKPEYQAKALLWIDSQQPYLVEPDRYAKRDFVANQVGLIASSLVLAPVVGRAEIIFFSVKKAAAGQAGGVVVTQEPGPGSRISLGGAVQLVMTPPDGPPVWAKLSISARVGSIRKR